MQESLNFFLNRKAHSKQKCRILARIVYIEKHTVCTPLQPPHKGAMSCTQPVTSAPPPGSTHLPAMPALSGKSGSGGLDGGFGDVNVESVGCNFLFSPAAAPAVAAVESFTGAPARGHTTTGRTADREKEVSSNPYNLPPGTVYYECFAEPVTIVKYTK